MLERCVARAPHWRVCYVAGVPEWENTIRPPRIRGALAGLVRTVEDLVEASTKLLTVAFACESRLEPALFARRNEERMSLDFTDDVFLLHFALKASQCAFERLAVA